MQDREVLNLAAKVKYRIDPDNEYPANYSGHVRLVLKDGSVHEAGQPHLRGGAREPLSDAELSAKFQANAAYGNWPSDDAAKLEAFCNDLFGGAPLEAFRAYATAPE
jgi:2-methylcitrate dehydratase PrpD